MRISPDPRSLSVVCSAHAIFSAHIWQVVHKGSALQIPRVWIFQKPQAWLIEFNDRQALLYQRISLCEISGCLGCSARKGVHCAVWATPDDVKVSSWESSIVVPGHDITLNCRSISPVPIHISYLPARLAEGLARAPCATAEEEGSWHAAFCSASVS